jgi:hypothetical protein
MPEIAGSGLTVMVVAAELGVPAITAESVTTIGVVSSGGAV